VSALWLAFGTPQGRAVFEWEVGDLGYNVALLLLPVQTGANGSYVVTPEEKAADNGELRAQGEASWTSLRRTSVRYCP
jgi:hypothetical protein